MNLNEVSIAISKAREGLDRFSLIFTIVPELLLIHGLEKTYLFLLNTLWKTHTQRGSTFALITRGTQSRREELIMSRPFPFILRLQRRLTERGWDRNIVIETPIGGLRQGVYPIEVESYKVKLAEDLMKEIIKAMF